MAKKTLQQIIEELDPESVRTALVQQQNRVKTMIAERVVGYQTEQVNPTYTSDDVRNEVLRVIEREIIGLEELQQTITERLKDSDGILKGLMPNRAAKRRIEKKESANGKRPSKVRRDLVRQQANADKVPAG